MGWWPFSSLNQPTVVEIAQHHGKTPAQVNLRWQLQRGLVVNPRTESEQHMADNLAVFDFNLTEVELAAIEGVPNVGLKNSGKVCPDPSNSASAQQHAREADAVSHHAPVTQSCSVVGELRGPCGRSRRRGAAPPRGAAGCAMHDGTIPNRRVPAPPTARCTRLRLLRLLSPRAASRRGAERHGALPAARVRLRGRHHCASTLCPSGCTSCQKPPIKSKKLLI